MIDENLQPIGETGSIAAGFHLEATGLGIEHFSPYFRMDDQFHTHKHVEFLFRGMPFAGLTAICCVINP